MHHLIGKKEVFAVELELTGNKWDNKTAIWLNDTRIGDWDDENLLAPFLRSLRTIALKYREFWLDELMGLDCHQIYLTIHPFYNDPDNFFSLSETEMDELTRFDKFLLTWGENFDSWGLSLTCRDEVYKFMWVHSPNGKEDSFEVRNDVKCFDVAFRQVQDVYQELLNIIPKEAWPMDSNG